MKNNPTLKLFTFILIITMYSSCIKNNDFDYDKIASSSWNPDVAVPLIHSSLDIKDIIAISDSNSFSIGADHLVTLIYRGNIYSIKGEDFLPVIDQSDNQNFILDNSDSTVLYSTGNVSKTVTRTLPYIFPGGESIDSIFVKTGSLIANINSDVPHSGTLTISIPTAIKNGQPLNYIVPFSYSGSPISISSAIPLDGYQINLASTGIPNVVNIYYTLSYNNSGSLNSVTNKTFTCITSFNNIFFQSIYGNVGQRGINLYEDSSRITLFDNFQNGNVYFEDPKMTFFLSNSFGMPIDAHVTSLSAINSSGNLVPFIGAIPDPLPIGYPVIPGQTSTNNFILDKNNSNIQNVISQAPRYIVYTLNATSNIPNAPYNFIQDTSQFKADIQIDFPLRGYANGFEIQDTAVFSLEKIDQIESAVFRINIDNGFPATAFTQIYFTDSNYVVLDSMLLNPQNAIVESALVNANGIVIQNTHKTTDEPFSKSRLQHLYNARHLLIHSVINTKDSPGRNVAIYDYYKLDVKIGVRAQLNIKFN